MIPLKCTSKSISGSSISKDKFNLGFPVSVKKIPILKVPLQVKFVPMPLSILTLKSWMVASYYWKLRFMFNRRAALIAKEYFTINKRMYRLGVVTYVREIQHLYIYHLCHWHLLRSLLSTCLTLHFQWYSFRKERLLKAQFCLHELQVFGYHFKLCRICVEKVSSCIWKPDYYNLKI